MFDFLGGLFGKKKPQPQPQPRTDTLRVATAPTRTYQIAPPPAVRGGSVRQQAVAPSRAPSVATPQDNLYAAEPDYARQQEEEARRMAEENRRRIAAQARQAMQEAQDMIANAKDKSLYAPEMQALTIEAAKGGEANVDRLKEAQEKLANKRMEAEIKNRVEPLFKRGLSFEDMANESGVSTQEIQEYAKKNHKNYGDKGLIKNTKRVAGDFVKGMVVGAAGIASKPVNNLFDQENQAFALEQINRDMQEGKILPNRAMELAQKEAARGIAKKAFYNEQTGRIEYRDANTAEFAGETIQQGINTGSVLPFGGGVAAGAARLTTGATRASLQNAARILSMGTATQAESAAARALLKANFGDDWANLIGNAVTSNAKQAGIWGTAQTGADVLNGNGISPESVALNYGGEFLLGALPEVALGSLGPVFKNIATSGKLNAEDFAKLPPEIQRQFGQMTDEQVVEAATKYSKELPEASQSNVKWKDTAAGRSYLEDMKDPVQKAYQTKAGREAAVVEMTPDEYLQRVYASSEMDGGLDTYMTRLESEVKSRGIDLSKGEVEMPYVNMVNGGQDGAHRAMAAKMAGESNIPVLLVDKPGTLKTDAKLSKRLPREDWKPWGDDNHNAKMQYILQDNKFFTEKTGHTDIDRILKNEDTVGGGEKVADYYRRAKGEDWGIEYMSPDEYLRRAEVAMGNDPANAGKYKSGDPEKYAADMKKGDKFDMPWINEARGTQEGRTRALAAKAAGMEIIPVAVAKKVEAGAKLSKGTSNRYDEITPDDMPEIIRDYRRRFGAPDDFGDDRVQLVDGKTAGKNDTTMGSYKYVNDMIDLVEGKANKGTFNHETVHKAIGQFLSDSEMEGLYKDIVNFRGGKKAIQKYYQENGYEGISWRGAAEEELANVFNMYLSVGRSLEKSMGKPFDFKMYALDKGVPESVVKVIYELMVRIEDFFSDLKGVEGSKARVDAFYKKLEEGGFVNAERRTTKYVEPTTVGRKVQEAAGDALIKVGRDPRAPGIVHKTGLDLKYPASRDAKLQVDTINQGVAHAAEERGVEPSFIKKFFRGAQRELIRPNNDLHALDKELAKFEGRKVGELDPANQLTTLANNVRDANKQADGSLNKKTETGLSVNNLLRKYNASGKGESPEWRRFHQFLNQRFALEVHKQSDKKKWILGDDFDPADVEASVAAYTKENPGSIRDAQTIKHWADSLVDEGIASGQITQEFGDAVKSMYQNYVPLSRVFDEALVRPTISGGTGMTVNKQNVIRALTEGSDKALDDSPELFIDRGREVFRKAHENRFVNELYRRQQLGLHKGRVELEIDPDVTRAHQEYTQLYDDAVATLKDARATRDALKTAKKDVKGEVPAANKDIQLAQVKAANVVRKLLRKVAGKADTPLVEANSFEGLKKAERAYNSYIKKNTDEYGAPIDQTKTTADLHKEAQSVAQKAAGKTDEKLGSFQAFADVAPYADSLTDKQALDILKAMQNYDLEALRTTTARIEKSNKKLAGLTAKIEELTVKLDEARTAAKDAKETTSFLWHEKAGTVQQARSGIQALDGLREGDKMRLRIDAQLADQLQYLKDVKGAGRISGLIAAPLKLLYTGAGAPVYAAKQIIRNPLLAYVNVELSRTLRPMALVEGTRGGFLGSGKWYKELVDDFGYDPPTFTQTPHDTKASVDLLSARGGGKKGLIAFTVTHPKQWPHALNQLGGRFENALRVHIARGEYQWQRSHGATHEKAMRFAAKRGNEALGDLRTVSKTARRMEAFTPYSGATQAGFRAMLDAVQDRPVSTLMKLASIPATVAGFTVYNLSQDRAQEYYEQAIEQDRTYDLDSNIVIFTPWAQPVGDKGEWTGIIKLPVAPDFQPLLRAAWQNAMQATLEGKIDPKKIGLEALNMATADYGRNLYDPQDGVLPATPLRLAAVLWNADPNTGEQLGSEKDIERGFNSGSSDQAKMFSEMTGGNVSALQIDALMREGGFIGKALREGNFRGTLGKSLIGAFYGGKLKSDAQKSFEVNEELEKAVLTDDKQKALYTALNTKRTADADMARSLGMEVPDDVEPGILDSATKAMILLGNEQILELEMEKAALNRAKGELANPLFDETVGLTPQQRRAILTYRSGKIYNSAGQNKDESGDSAFTALGLDDTWYDDFKEKENNFYVQLGEKTKKDLATAEEQLKANPKDADLQAEVKKLKTRVEKNEDDNRKTFSGTEYPEASDELQAKLDYYSTLPRGTGDRSRYIDANPDIAEFWNKRDAFTDAERKALGFKSLFVDDNGDGQPDKEADGSYRKRGGYGKSSGGGRRGGGSAKEKMVSTNPSSLLTDFGGQGSGLKDVASKPKTAPKLNLSQYENKRVAQKSIKIKL